MGPFLSIGSTYMSGRPPKLTAVHQREGTTPRRRIYAEPKPTAGLGPPPTRLGRRERRVWAEIARAFPEGEVFGASDRLAIERLSVTVVRWRDCDDELRRIGLTVIGQKGERVKNPLTSVARALG